MDQIASATYEYETAAKAERGPARIDALLGDLDAGLDLLAKQTEVLRSRLAPVSVDRGSVPSEGPQDSPIASPVADRIDTAISRVRRLAGSLAEAADQLEI